ncbi:hypothetical protein B7P43_G05009, partial [Cryptotermes secundus]
MQKEILKTEQLTEENVVTGKALQEKEAETGRLAMDNLQLTSELLHKKQETESLAKENELLSKELDGKLPEIARITDENKRLGKELQEKESMTEKLTEENSRLAKKLQSEITQIEDLTNQNVKLGKRSVEIVTEAERLTEENSRMRKCLQEKKSMLQHVTEQNGNIGKELKEFEQEINQFTDENRRLTELAEKRKTDIHSLKHEKLRKEFQWKKSEIERLKQEIAQNEKTEEWKGLLNDFTFIEHKLQTVEMQTKSQMEMNRNLEDQLHEKKVILENMEKENAQLENKLINTEEEIHIVAGKARDLEMKLLSKEQTIKSLRESCDVYGDQIRAGVKEMQRLTERIGGLEKDMQVKEKVSLKLKNENCDTGKKLQEKDPETKEVTEENVKLMAMPLIKKRDRLEEEENEILGNVSETQTGKFNVQLMRKIKDFQGPSCDNTDFGMNLKMKVEELMELTERKRTAEEGFLSKQCELQKFRDDNTGLIKRTETWKGTTSFRAQNVDFCGGKQNEKTNVGNKGNDNDLGEEFRNESAVSEIDNCHTEARKLTKLMNVKTGIKTDTRQTEIQNTSRNEIHADSDGVQHPATATGIKRPGVGRHG